MSRRAGFALCTALAVVVLCILGTWQMQRLFWKEALIADMVAGHEAASVAPGPRVSEWARVRLSGEWLAVDPVIIGPVVLSGRTGWYVVSPLVLTTGDMIFVNRGWLADRNLAKRAVGKVEGMVGVLRRPGPLGMFSPPNEPAKNQWFRVTPAELAKALGITNAAPYWVDAMVVSGGAGLTPVGTLRLPPNNHLQYAVTWYAFALTAAVIGVIFWVRNK